MKFMDVKSTGCTLKLSKIAKGADHFGVTIPKERAFALMDRYLELGGNVIDTARLYGRARPFDAEFAHSEPIVGEWLRTRFEWGLSVDVGAPFHAFGGAWALR